MNIEPAIAKVFPEWALRRQQARIKLDLLNQYRQLIPGRDRAPMTTWTSTEDREFDFTDRLRVISALRRMSRENPLIAGILNTFTVNVVGQGIRPLPATGDPKFDAECAAYFSDWSDNPELRGMCDFWDFQKIILKTMLTDSDCGIVLTDTGLIQGIEGDAIQTPARFAHLEGFSISQGVQYTPTTGRPERYWALRRRNSRDYLYDQTSATGIDARYFVHVMDVERFSQYRGFSPLFSSIDWIRDLDEICDYTKFAFKVQSIFAIALVGGEDNSTKPGLAGYGASSAPTAAKPPIDLQKGTILDLSKYNAKDVKQLAPTQPGPHFKEFSEFIQQMLGLGCGLPLDLVTYKLHEGNYSSQRMVFRVSYKTFLQKAKIVAKASQTTYAWAINRAIAAGVLKPSYKVKYPTYARWSPPMPEVADPEKEIAASLWSEIAGYSDKEQECLARGRDRSEIAAKQQDIIADMKARGLPFVISPTPGVKTLDEINASVERMKKS